MVNALHFTQKELQCKCCGALPTPEKLQKMIAFLEWVRGITGGRINVHSAYRCPAHNTAIKGANNSRHMICAVDISSPNLTPKDLYMIIGGDKKASAGGLGLYAWGVHWDDGRKRRWAG